MAVRCGTETLSVLPALYYLTAADYTSKFGTKRAALYAELQNHLSIFVQDLSNTEIKKSVGDAEKYFIKVLRKKTSCKTFNELRYWMYQQQKCFFRKIATNNFKHKISYSNSF
ncbi:unnamed protein product [Psylliodes chrysocephalus]|uniref:Uncharacterized protein n=1 Tax=Psylliodes chrysocephalus TaxID=3402493 RepID=A0A9P0CTR3_9CUCU|nr:unnamed protein product [Psylliodes chrysocephala]